MNWRWAVPGLLCLAFVEVPVGIAVYNSTPWDRWDAVRQACMITVPAIVAAAVVALWLLVAALEWAQKGQR